MRIVTPSSFLLVSLASGCATQAQFSADYASKCEDAERRGVINLAEAACERAWLGVDSSSLDSNVQSERLYNLARIKRQLEQYAEANKYIRQSLAIEETVSGINSPAYGLRLVELSLCLAGQGRFTEGVNALESVLSIVDRFSEKDRASTANIFRYYSSRINNTEQMQLANQFKDKAKELKTLKKKGA